MLTVAGGGDAGSGEAGDPAIIMLRNRDGWAVPVFYSSAFTVFGNFFLYFFSITVV